MNYLREGEKQTLELQSGWAELPSGRYRVPRPEKCRGGWRGGIRTCRREAIRGSFESSSGRKRETVRDGLVLAPQLLWFNPEGGSAAGPSQTAPSFLPHPVSWKPNPRLQMLCSHLNPGSFCLRTPLLMTCSDCSVTSSPDLPVPPPASLSPAPLLHPLTDTRPTQVLQPGEPLLCRDADPTLPTAHGFLRRRPDIMIWCPDPTLPSGQRQAIPMSRDRSSQT